MNGRAAIGSFGAGGVLIVALVLLAAVGFCLFEGDHGDHHASSLHVCSTMLVGSATAASIVVSVVAGGALMLSAPRVTAVTLGVPVPPPKLSVSL